MTGKAGGGEGQSETNESRVNVERDEKEDEETKRNLTTALGLTFPNQTIYC